jgi:hypothetical protein
MGKHLCEVCHKNEIVGVACVPGIPYSAGYCVECLRANAHPWDILVGQVACIGGLDKVHGEFVQMVECTCKHLDKTLEQFNAEVQQSIKSLEKYEDYEDPEE